MTKDFRENINQLLGREPNQSDGINIQQINDAETRLKTQLPEPLKQLYLQIGNVEMFVNSFNEFFTPDELSIEDGRLVFAQENQGVCAWGVDLPYEDKNPGEVWMLTDADGKTEWYPENYNLPSFINVLIYYNCAQGGFENGANMDIEEFEENKTLQADLEKKWEKVVHHNGLVIYALKDNLIWHFYDANENIIESVYLSSRTMSAFNQLCNKYGFIEL